MGGLVFVIVMVAALGVVPDALFVDLVFLVVLCAAIGAVDDMLEDPHGANRGLPARTKLLATALAAAIFLRAIDAGQTPYNGVVFHRRDVLHRCAALAVVVARDFGDHRNDSRRQSD